MSDGTIAYLLRKRDFLWRQIRKTDPEKAPIHYRSLLCQIDEVELELFRILYTPRPKELLESGIPTKYWRILGWLALGFCCLVGVVNVLN